MLLNIISTTQYLQKKPVQLSVALTFAGRLRINSKIKRPLVSESEGQPSISGRLFQMERKTSQYRMKKPPRLGGLRGRTLKPPKMHTVSQRMK